MQDYRPNFQEGEFVKRRTPLGCDMAPGKVLRLEKSGPHGEWMATVQFANHAETFLVSEYVKS